MFAHPFLCFFKYHLLSRRAVTALFKTSYLLPIYLYSIPAFFFSPWHLLTPKIQHSALLCSYSLLPLSPNVSFKKLGFLFTFLHLKSLSCVQYSSWNSPGQNTGVGSLSLLLGIFPTQGSNLGLPHCGQILYQPSHPFK